MSEAFYSGAYWGARAESAKSCSERLARFLGTLAEINPLLGSWYRKGNDRGAALHHAVQLDPDSLAAMLAAGRQSQSNSMAVHDDLGFSAGLWNGSDIEVGLMITCGASSPRVSNAVVLSFPKADGPAADLYRPDVARAILRALVESWEPSWATWTSHRLRRAQEASPRELVVGWLTYLAAERPVDIAGLPAGVSADVLAGGIVIAIGDNVSHASEEIIRAERKALGRSVLPSE